MGLLIAEVRFEPEVELHHLSPARVAQLPIFQGALPLTSTSKAWDLPSHDLAKV